MSKRNIFPVIDDDDSLQGLVLLDDIREIMFDSSVYDTTKVYDLMVAPPETIDIQRKHGRSDAKIRQNRRLGICQS